MEDRQRKLLIERAAERERELEVQTLEQRETCVHWPCVTVVKNKSHVKSKLSHVENASEK